MTVTLLRRNITPTTQQKESVMSKSITPVNESDWLLQRTKYIGSTESPALFGLSPYKTIAELFYEKQSGEVHSIPDNMRMMAGRALESGIAELAAHELGCIRRCVAHGLLV